MSNSIGVICNRLNQRDVFIKFVDDVLIDAGVVLVGVPANQMKRVVEIMDLFRLDFDDAYQYVAAELEKANIVSFEQDFDGSSVIVMQWTGVIRDGTLIEKGI
jgi:predicted nucleic acid-binding protein